MSDRTQAEIYAQRFIAIYKKTLPDFDCDMALPEFGQCELTKENGQMQAQILYYEIKAKKLDFFTGEMYVDDILFRLGVVLNKDDHLKRRKHCPYNPSVIKQANDMYIAEGEERFNRVWELKLIM